MKVVTSLYKNSEGFGPNQGWEKKVWTRALTIDGVTSEHKCNYIIHLANGHIITSQHKAWNDSVRMAMYVDLVLKPIHDKNGGKSFVWADNCGCHKTPCVKGLLDLHGIPIALLPPNMTDVLQVIDLVINGPIKQHMRSVRA